MNLRLLPWTGLAPSPVVRRSGPSPRSAEAGSRAAILASLVAYALIAAALTACQPRAAAPTAIAPPALGPNGRDVPAQVPGGDAPWPTPDLGTAQLGLTAPITLTLFDGTLTGEAEPTHQRRDIWLVDSGATKPARHLGDTDAASGAAWEVRLENEAGEAIYPARGDAILLPAPRDAGSTSPHGSPAQAATEMALIPFVDLEFHRAAGRITGRAPPGLLTAVTMELAPAPASKADLASAATGAPVAPDFAVPTLPHPPADVRATQADAASTDGAIRATSPNIGANGAFELHLLPSGSLEGGRAMTLTLTTAQNLTAVVRRRVPYTRVSLHPGDIIGAGAPLAPVTVTLRAANEVLRGIGRGFADARGDFRVWVLDEDGDRVRPAVGDRVRIEAGDGDWTVAVADLTAGAAADANRLQGAGVPGARVDLTVWNPWRPGEYARPTTTVETSGAWSTDPGVPIEPATHFYITQHLADGDLLFFCQQLPRLHLQPGSPHVRIEALADLEATLALQRRGKVVATASGEENWAGELVLDLVNQRGASVALAAEDRLVGTVNGRTIDLVLPPFEATLDAAGSTVRGQTTPGSTVFLAAPSPLLDSRRTAGADGGFAMPIESELLATGGPAPGAGFTAYTETSERHNVGRRFVGPELIIDLDSAVVTVEDPPGARARWLDGDSAAATADLATAPADSAATIPGPRTIDLPPAALPDTSLVLQVGHARIPLAIPDLSLTFDPSTGIARGRGPAEEALELIVLQGERSPGDSLGAVVAPDGSWSVDLRGEPGKLHRVDPARVRRLELRWNGGPGIAYRREWRRRG